MPASSKAARYLRVRLDPVSVSGAARVRHRVWAFIVWFSPEPLWLVFDWEPKDPTVLRVLRRSDDAVLVEFEHDRLLEAITHRDDLDKRLHEEHVFDVCRQLGIAIDQVGTPQD